MWLIIAKVLLLLETSELIIVTKLIEIWSLVKAVVVKSTGVVSVHLILAEPCQASSWSLLGYGTTHLDHAGGFFHGLVGVVAEVVVLVAWLSSPVCLKR